MPVINPQALLEDRVTALQAYHATTRIPRAELDVSGGVDSAVLLGLLVRALGADQVTAVYSNIQSSAVSGERARAAAAAFGVRLVQVDLSAHYTALIDTMHRALGDAGFDLADVDARIRRDPTVLGGIRSCLRAPVGRGFNRMTGVGIRHGTGNEDEDRWVRFYQKGGDGEVDTNPIEMLAKGEVFQLARVLGVPRCILEARPTPDLWATGEAHNDEDEYTSFIGFDPGPHGLTWYSYVDLETGAYTRAGLIERVSRLLDQPLEGGETVERVLFADPVDGLPAVREKALATGLLALPPAAVDDLLPRVRRVERITRHKLNPAIPMLGTRADLVARGILTDRLS